MEYPKFTVLNTTLLGSDYLIGTPDRTAVGSEIWIKDGCVGYLRRDSIFVLGRWHQAGEQWRFTPAEPTAVGLLRDAPEYDVFDGYWGERAALVLSDGLEWQEAVWLDAMDHEHCFICWAKISVREAARYFIASDGSSVGSCCYETYVRTRSLDFIVG